MKQKQFKIKTSYIKQLIYSLLIIILTILRNTNQIEVTQIFSPLEIYSQNFDDILNKGIIYENYAIVSASSLGLYTYDITNQQYPQLLYIFQNGEKTSMQSANLFNYDKGINQMKFLLLANGDYGVCLIRLETGQKLLCQNAGYIVQHIIQISNDQIILVGQGNISLFKIEFENYSIEYIKNNNINFIKQITQLYRFNSGASTSNKCILDSQQKYLYVVEDSDGIAVYDFSLIMSFDSNPLMFHIFYYEMAYDMVLTDDLQYLYMVDFFSGIYVTDISNMYSLSNPTLSDLITYEIYSAESVPNSIQISKDNNIIYMGMRTYGILIFDISDRLNPKLLQTIDSLGYAYSISFTESEQMMMFCNGYTLRFYQSSIPNFSNDFPNIFDDKLANLLSLDKNVNVGGSTYFQEVDSPWTIKIDDINKLIFIAAERAGTIVYSFKDDPFNPTFYFSIDVDSSSNPADAVQIKGNYLYIGEGWGGIKIYDISDIDNPVNWSYDGYIYLSGDSDSIEITNDEQYMIVANGGTGISLVNIADKTNPFQIGQWNNDKPKGSAENVLLNSMENLVFGSIRNYGLVILDISDKSQAPVEIGEYYTGMCEFVTLSSNEKFIYLSDGTQGITILDIQDIKNPLFITSQQIGGFPTKMKMIQYGELEYLLVNTRDKELLNAINITDVYNPSLFGKYDPGYEQAFDLAYTEDQKYLYMLTDEGLRVLQISNPLNIHTEMVRIDFDGQISGKVENGQVFIGESLQMIIVPIGLGRQYQINNIFYYYNYEIIQAPSWLDFDPVQSLIYITVDNQGLTDGLEFQNNLIFTEIQLQVTSKLFIDNDIPLTESDGDKIIKDSIKNGYLTNGGYLTEKFYPNQDLFNYNDSFYTDQVLSKIIEVFSGSVFNIPAKFTISNSMFFDPSQTEPLMVLDTYSSQIEIIVEIQDTSKALFVEKNYIGATVILSDAHDYLAIKGDSTLAIQNMVNDMRIQNYTENLNEIKLNFIFDDYLNFQQKYRNIPFTDYQFLKLHEGVSINEAIPIQDQFNQIYADGKVTIEEDFTFQFQEDSFISPAGIELKYQFQMETEYGNGKYANFPQDFWLVTNPVDRRISGTPPQMKIYTKQRIKVTASDGYSTCDAYFLIKIWNFSFFNVILDIMEYAGPILFVLGVWSYKYTLYKIFFPKKYKYTEEVAIVGMEYKKVIPLMQDNLQKGIFLFNLLDLKKDFYQFWTEFGDINKEQLMSLIRHEAEKNPKLIQKNQIDIRDLQKKDSKLTMVIIGLGAIWVMKNQHKHTYKAFQELEKYGKQRYNEIDWFKKFVHITYPDYDEADEANDSEEDQFFSELEVNEEIQVGDNQIHGGFYNKEVVKQQIEQNLNKFNNDSVQMKKNINNTQKIFTNPNLKNDQKKGTVHASYHYHPKNFPILHIFDNILIEFFKQRKIALEQEIQKKQTDYQDKYQKELNINLKEETIHLQRYNMYLLKECIYASVFGISFEKFYFPAVSKGISINQFEYQLNSIMGYERITEPSCLEDGYEQCGLKTNQPLPSWLKVTISNGLIILQGTPKVSNKGQYKIEIYHDCGVILQHHKISVQSNKVNKRESEELIENLNQYQSQIEEVATQVGNNKLQHDIQIEKTSMNKVQNDKNNQDQFNSNKELISQKRTSAIFETNQQIYINEYTYQDDASQSDFIGSQNYIFQNKNRLSNNKYVENIQTNNFVSESAQHTERKNKKYAPITTVIDKQIIDDVQ